METKKKYISPSVDCVLLDNEISLALQSAPPEGPDEVFNFIQNPMDDHFKTV